jgi:hypothetical protein
MRDADRQRSRIERIVRAASRCRGVTGLLCCFFSTHMRAGLVGGVLVALVCLRAMKRVRVAYSSRSRYRFDIARLAIALFVVIVFDLVLVGTHDAFR